MNRLQPGLSTAVWANEGQRNFRSICADPTSGACLLLCLSGGGLGPERMGGHALTGLAKLIRSRSGSGCWLLRGAGGSD
jgi:hypothetical protein